MLTGIASLARNLPGIRRVLSQHITKYNPINIGEQIIIISKKGTLFILG